MIALVVWSALALFAAAFVFFSTFIVVTDGHVAVVERFGKFARVLSPGLHILLPVVEATKTVHWTYLEDRGGEGATRTVFRDWRIPISERMFDPPQADAATRDRIPVDIDVVVYYAIVDPKKAVYAIEDLYAALEAHVETAVRTALSHMTLDEATEGAVLIERAIRADLASAEKEWGLSLRKVRIQNLAPSPAISKATEAMVQAQRETEARFAREAADVKTRIAAAEAQRRVATIEWETEEQRTRSVVTRRRLEIESDAEAQKRAALLGAEAQAETAQLLARVDVQRVTEMLAAGATHEYLIKAAEVAAFEALAANPRRGDMVVPIEYARFMGTGAASIRKAL